MQILNLYACFKSCLNYLNRRLIPCYKNSVHFSKSTTNLKKKNKRKRIVPSHFILRKDEAKHFPRYHEVIQNKILNSFNKRLKFRQIWFEWRKEKEISLEEKANCWFKIIKIKYLSVALQIAMGITGCLFFKWNYFSNFQLLYGYGLSNRSC